MEEKGRKGEVVIEEDVGEVRYKILEVKKWREREGDESRGWRERLRRKRGEKLEEMEGKTNTYGHTRHKVTYGSENMEVKVGEILEEVEGSGWM